MATAPTICGEETAAQIRWKARKASRAEAAVPNDFGLQRQPTTINNTETFAAVPWIIRQRRRAYLEVGKLNGGINCSRFPATSGVPAILQIDGHAVLQLLELAGGMRGKP